jgi:hypothetical protein
MLKRCMDVPVRIREEKGREEHEQISANHNGSILHDLRRGGVRMSDKMTVSVVCVPPTFGESWVSRRICR